ncbi:flagellar biosynthesis regulator FlaF [Pseudooceanicola sp. LIPI14-2-Ac024]|uniref:flagellar biosynthesis regulator FlaF n=1 Tax=Pseudooceanicola sp. LIPI14-2-Ac024 TaxID=3344875 RepID=UPI0035CFA79A
MSIAAYKRTIRESESPRQIEVRVFTRITGNLRKHLNDYEAAQNREDRSRILADGLRHALIENQKLWIALRDDLAGSGNQLPAQLRAQLLSIALWTHRQTSQVLGGNPGLRALVDVNANILAGLSRAQPQAVTSDGTQSYAQTV